VKSFTVEGTGDTIKNLHKGVRKWKMKSG